MDRKMRRLAVLVVCSAASLPLGLLAVSTFKVAGIDLEKMSDDLVEGVTGVAEEKRRQAAAQARARADYEQCQADNRKAVAEAHAEYRKADGEWKDCADSARYRSGPLNNPEIWCRTENTVRTAMKARLDAAKAFVCTTASVK